MNTKFSKWWWKLAQKSKFLPLLNFDASPTFFIMKVHCWKKVTTYVVVVPRSHSRGKIAVMHNAHSHFLQHTQTWNPQRKTLKPKPIYKHLWFSKFLLWVSIKKTSWVTRFSTFYQVGFPTKSFNHESVFKSWMRHVSNKKPNDRGNFQTIRTKFPIEKHNSFWVSSRK